MKKQSIGFCLQAAVLCIIFCISVYSEEMPRPTYDNSFIFGMVYSIASDGAVNETSALKEKFSNGLYAPLVCSTFTGLNMSWTMDIGNASSGIRDFKNTVDDLFEKAYEYKVGIHITITYGFSRNPQFYYAARNEDIRNAQWYNDNNIMSAARLDDMDEASGENRYQFPHDPKKYNISDDPQYLSITNTANQYSITTFSRYARKLRKHMDAKAAAALEYLANKQRQNPGILLIVSGPGEAEMNGNPLNQGLPHLVDYFCDFSPFAVLEFRDWIRHRGLYAQGEKYAGEGYSEGGNRYTGAEGLQNFNRDFGTNFSTWDLRYYHWNLSDPVDDDFSDNTNPDTNVIPVGNFVFGEMMPEIGPGFINGGFDPPRVMLAKGEDAFWDLWQRFRETMVRNYVKDIASIARRSEFPRKQYYTHQIPADYLFGTRPDDPNNPLLNRRYYTSASPLWTADAYNDIGLGVTMYDINFGTWYARTSQYILPPISAMSDNWAAVEYNPEVTETDLNTPVNIYNQLMRLYNNNAHCICLFKWMGEPQFQFKGTNRETAAKLFFDAIKDKARRPTNIVFTPKSIENFSSDYNASIHAVDLHWSENIWPDMHHKWHDWGDFKEFIIYRGYSEYFQCNASSEIARVRDYTYRDTTAGSNNVVYYKITAINKKGEHGPIAITGLSTNLSAPVSRLDVSRSQLNFAVLQDGSGTLSQSFSIENTGGGVLNWTLNHSSDWLTCTPTLGMNSGTITATINPTGKSPGRYTTTITVTAPNAENAPQTIQITLVVYANGQDSAPFGFFETPEQGSTVYSNIPVSGWVLDDIGVEKLEIYRDPVPGEGTKWIYIGDAVFVEGARPDVERDFSGYPNNYKAGWGYMMLTNFLPNQGNGTFIIHALATDTSGHQSILGSKTITCDNANASKPFGTIDTPLAGSTASGSHFINWGWVLTPRPNSIPTDGSTIGVYVDGVFLGHPVYNIHRSDIETLFPGYANSGGAVGYFYIDTRNYSNGVHTIAWNARDSGGNIDGLGSRYFLIDNSGIDSSDSMNYKKSRQSTQTEQGKIYHYASQVADLPIIRLPAINIKTGYDSSNTPNRLFPTTEGSVNVSIKECQRIEIHLGGIGETKAVFDFQPAYWQVENRLKPLPIGSTFDKEKGTFYWQPGPGFRGKFDFVFPLKTKSEQLSIRRITIWVK